MQVPQRFSQGSSILAEGNACRAPPSWVHARHPSQDLSGPAGQSLRAEESVCCQTQKLCSYFTCECMWRFSQVTPVQAGKTGKAAHPTSNHGKAEAIYWDARRKADALRWVPPPLHGTELGS